MSALTNCTDPIVVNVGGTIYQTTMAKLTKITGSHLSALAELFAASGDEVLFIDRDGPSFRYVLNYLRDPFFKPLLPRDPTELDQLAREADFYRLPGLLNRSSTNGWKGESACTQVVTQAELDGIEGPRQFPCRDLRGCSLRFMDLTGWNLRGCNLAGVDATGVDFTEANLRGCNMVGVQAIGANFTSADLCSATLAGANLQEAKFSGAIGLPGTKFAGANVRRARFTADMRGQIERQAADGPYFGPPFEPRPPNWVQDPPPFSQYSMKVGAIFETVH